MSLMKDDVEIDIVRERERQDIKWGVQNHEPFKWLAILGEEVGEVNKACLESFDWKKETFQGKNLTEIRTELVQVAAVTKAFIECIDRNYPQ